MKNYYKILGLNYNATKKDISHAYKVLALKYHPDVNKEKDAQEKFKEISKGYQILKNPLTKKEYDIKLKNFLLQSFNTNSTSFKSNASYSYQNNFQGSYKNTYYNQASSTYANSSYKKANDTSTSSKNQSLKSNIFKKIFNKIFKINFNLNIFSSIKNRLEKRKIKIVNKNTFHFSKFILSLIRFIFSLLHKIVRILFLPFIFIFTKCFKKQKSTFFLYDVQLNPLEAIFGTHKFLKIKNEDVKIYIPPFSYNGKVMSYQIKSAKKPVIVSISVLENDNIEVEKRGIIVNVPVSIKEAIMGSEIKIPTPKGIINVILAQNTKDNTLIKIKDSTIVLQDGTSIDIYFRVTINTPKKFNNETFQNALKELDKYFNYKKRDNELKNVFNI